MGSSRPLDFGHWSAHKLEQLTNYRLRHGEAVAIGIGLDVTYSYLQNMITKAEWERILDVFKRSGFELYVPELEAKPNQPNHEVSYEKYRKAISLIRSFNQQPVECGV
jgi:3-dehydroquinate synthase